MSKDVLGQSAAANVLGARKRSGAASNAPQDAPERPGEDEEAASPPAKKATRKKTATKKNSAKAGGKKKATRKKGAAKKTSARTIDLSGAGDDLLEALPTARVASGSDRKIKLQPELYVRLVKLCEPFGDRRSPQNRREKLVSPGKLASVATDALLQAHGQELHELARAAGRQTVDTGGILTVGTHADGTPHTGAPKNPWVTLSETTWARLTKLTGEARNVRDEGGRRIITAEAIANEAVFRWLEANEDRWLTRGRELA